MKDKKKNTGVIMGKKVISFSIWRNSKYYVFGGILNADIAAKEWPGWICRFYVSPNVPREAVDELYKKDNVEVVEMEQDESWNGMFWRFFAASDPEVEVAIFRDTDSRLYFRDKAAVDEWLESDKDVHIMRDNCQHGWSICGGAWGVRNGRLSYLREQIEAFSLKELMNKHGIDQIYLQNEIYDSIKHEAFVHDDWFTGFVGEEKHPFPVPRLRGDGWWRQEFPSWHCGLELDKEGHWFRDENCKHPECCRRCPACGVFHDNDYIGKTYEVEESDWKNYEHLRGVFG